MIEMTVGEDYEIERIPLKEGMSGQGFGAGKFWVQSGVYDETETVDLNERAICSYPAMWI